MENYRLRLMVCLCISLAPISAWAQTNSSDETMTTQEMIEFETKEFVHIDDKLNQIYGNLRTELDKVGKLRLRDAQRAWIVFRDAECLRLSDFARDGTLAPLLMLSCKTQLTADRVTAIGRNPLTGETN